MGSFNGPEPGSPELMIGKWKREREREREKKKKVMGTQALMEQEYFINRNAGLYISLVGWLLSYYTGWNFINSHERVTGRKARDLQMEEIACKCQTFLSLLSGRRKQTSDIFFFSMQIEKEVSLIILCCHNDTWFHLKLTILKPWDNQCIFLMEIFVLSYVNVLCIYRKFCQVGSA